MLELARLPSRRLASCPPEGEHNRYTLATPPTARNAANRSSGPRPSDNDRSSRRRAAAALPCISRFLFLLPSCAIISLARGDEFPWGQGGGQQYED